MIVYIHSHEIEDRGVTFGRHAAVRDICHIIVPEGTTVAGIVALVTAQVHDRGSIWTLIFNGHGDDARSGAIYFGNWIGTSDVAQFSPLAAFMNRTGRGVELHCCRSGSNDAFVQAMANAFNVRVTAGVENQSGPDVIPFTGIVSPIGGDQHGSIEGETVVAFPHGRSAPAHSRR
jgi:hypothetical protein